MGKKKYPPTLDDSAARGVALEIFSVQSWTDELAKEGYSEFYSGTKPTRTHRDKIVHRISKSRAWVRVAFTHAGAGPDLIAVNHAKKIILIGDVTAGPWSGADIKIGGKTMLPNDVGSGIDKNRPHFAKSIDDALQMVKHLPKRYIDYTVVVQESWRESEVELSKRIVVYKNRRIQIEPLQDYDDYIKSLNKSANAGTIDRPESGKPKLEERMTSKSTSTPNLPVAKIHKPGVKVRLGNYFQKIDIQKIKAKVKIAIITKSKIAANLGKNLIPGIVIGMIYDYLKLKLLTWLMEDFANEEIAKSLNSLEEKMRPEIENACISALNKHVYELKYRKSATFKFIISYRLIFKYHGFLFQFIPHKMILDRVFVTDRWSGVHIGMKQVSVKNNFSRNEGKLFEDETYQVYKSVSSMDLEYPDTGRPSIEGEWKEYFIDSNGGKTQFGLFLIKLIKNGNSLQINAKDNNGNKIKVYKTKWDGANLEFRIPAGTEGYNRYSLSFKNWDLLDGEYYNFAKEYGFSQREYDSEYSNKVQFERMPDFDVLEDTRQKEKEDLRLGSKPIYYPTWTN